MGKPISNSAAIRALRTRTGITLRDLAARAGITNGYLSKLEHGQANGTGPVLARVAAALEVDVSAITTPGVTHTNRTRRKARTTPDGGVTCTGRAS